MDTKPKPGADARCDLQPTENVLPGQVVFVLQELANFNSKRAPFVSAAAEVRT
jgi:hypothetical protein